MAQQKQDGSWKQASWDKKSLFTENKLLSCAIQRIGSDKFGLILPLNDKKLPISKEIEKNLHELLESHQLINKNEKIDFNSKQMFMRTYTFDDIGKISNFLTKLRDVKKNIDTKNVNTCLDQLKEWQPSPINKSELR